MRPPGAARTRHDDFVEGAMTTMLVLKRLAALAAVAAVGMLAGLAIGDTAFAPAGQPAPWEMTFQEAVTPVMEYITWFHNWLLVIITLITLFVLALLLICIF